MCQLGISGSGDGVEIANQERENGGRLDVGPQGREEGLTCTPMVSAGRGVEVEKGKGPSGNKLAVSRANNGDRRSGDAGQDGDGTLPSRGEEGLIATRAGKGEEGGREANFLKENNVRLMLEEKGGQAAEVPPLGGVEGEEGKKGGNRLAVVPMACCHLGCYQKCGEKGE